MIGDENQYNGNYDMYALAEDYTGNVADFTNYRKPYLTPLV